MIDDNIYRILNIQDKEDQISNAIAYIINSSCIFQDWFSKTICEIPSIINFTSSCAYARPKAEQSGVHDIVILYKIHDHTEKIVIIENKLCAFEGKDQTERCASDDALLSLYHRFKIDIPRDKNSVKYIYLSLFPDQVPKSAKFIIKYH